jgi:hypothetical protein
MDSGKEEGKVLDQHHKKQGIKKVVSEGTFIPTNVSPHQPQQQTLSH